MSIDVGARLRAVRKMRGFSQRELAKRVGVTNSTISLIEQKLYEEAAKILEPRQSVRELAKKGAGRHPHGAGGLLHPGSRIR